MAVTAQTLRLVDGLRAQLDTIVDTQVRDLVRMWATAWDEVAPDLTDALLTLLTTPGTKITRAQMRRSQRLAQALAIIADQLQRLADQAGVRISEDLAGLIATAGGAQASVIDSQLPPGSSLVDAGGWERVDSRQVTAIVERTTEQITSQLDPLPEQVMDVIRRELIRGVAAGSNPRETARRMVQRVEGHVNGRWGLSRALTIARTETLDAHREAARTARMENVDVLAGWIWISKLDVRSCPSCFARHGTFHEVDEPGPHDHQSGRCTAMPKTKTWAELGFEDIDEPTDITPDAGERFRSLPEEDQRRILGPRRYQAWVEGRYPMGDWSTRRTSPGWRDSYHVSPAPPLPPSGGAGDGGPDGSGSDPAGGDFGASLALGMVSDDTRIQVRRALDAIASVHGIDRRMPRLPVVDFAEPGGPTGQLLGSYTFKMLPGQLDLAASPFGDSVRLSVNTLDPTGAATVLHELGHFLDHKGLGVDVSRFASAVDPALLGWRRAIDNSAGFKLLREMVLHDPARAGHWATFSHVDTGVTNTWDPDPDHTRYLLDPRELFARSYAQWIATRSGRSWLLDMVMLADSPLPPIWQLAPGSRAPYEPHQWVAEDFEPIAAALDELFASLGLLRGGPR